MHTTHSCNPFKPDGAKSIIHANKKGVAWQRPSDLHTIRPIYCQASSLDFFATPATPPMVSMMTFGKVEIRMN